MANEESIVMVGDTIDVKYIYSNGLQEDSAFYLYDFYSDEKVPIDSIPVQSPIGQAVVNKKVNDICLVEGTENKILIVDIHKRTKNMGCSR